MSNERRSALIIAHPGHELRIFGWFEQARPLLGVLTTGSRSGYDSRFAYTAALAAQVGAGVSPLSGCYRDRDIYQAILAGDPTPFVDWTEKLTGELAAHQPECIVVDGWQMYNVTHDLVHLMARLAAGRTAARLGRPIEVFEFAVVPNALAADVPPGNLAFRHELDDAAFERKMAAARGYQDVQKEIDEIIVLEGADASRSELFRHVAPLNSILSSIQEVVPYESYGEQRVSAGIYHDVIRWNSHVRPLIESLIEMRTA